MRRRFGPTAARSVKGIKRDQHDRPLWVAAAFTLRAAASPVSPCSSSSKLWS